MSATHSRLAVGIVSGGLDSLLAIEVVRRMGFDVLALHFVMGYEPAHLRAWLADPTAPFRAGAGLESLPLHLEVIDIRADFHRLLKAPPHGFGRNLNPCIDCKILMLDAARQRMETEGAAFVFTGEVLGQRPMSQNRQSLDAIEKAAGLLGRLVRPLCGARLQPTEPELEGLFRREQLLAISGRSRKEQARLAADFGITDYPSPAGGCLLTDPGYAQRLADWLHRRGQENMSPDEAALLLIGRHILLPAGGKAVIGRHEAENEGLLRFGKLGGLMEASDFPGPTSLLLGPMTEADILAAGQLTARYGQGRRAPQVSLKIRWPDGSRRDLLVQAGEPAEIRLL